MTRVISIWLLGRGNVGSSLLHILSERAATIRDREGVSISVVGVSGRAETAFDPRGLDLAPSASGCSPWRTGPSRATDHDALLEEVARLERPVVVDCTAARGMERLYLRALERGVHVVTANKDPMVVASPVRAALFLAARRTGARLLYETTVGADLPVLAPIADRLRSGDVIRGIEGSLSGTLGFLADEVSRGRDLAGAVAEARERGYTEPDPAEDLSGRDVARKALILAREIGLDLSLDDVELEPFVPQSVLDRARDVGLDVALAEASPLFSARADRLRKESRVIRYLARILPRSASPLTVGPVVVGAEHPAAGLRGTEALVAIHSERAGDVPIVIRGPGAGGPATASGVLADILRLAG